MTYRDDAAAYDSRTDTLIFGDGSQLRVRDLAAALMTLTPWQLLRLATRAGIRAQINDPLEAGDAECIQDILSVCRGMPQHVRQVYEAGLSLGDASKAFQSLVRRRVSDQSHPKPILNQDIFRFFLNTGHLEGEFSFFVRHDRGIAMLYHQQRFADTTPYQEAFVIVRTTQRRYFLRWPENYPEQPAFHIDSAESAFSFFPASGVDFEELYPGYSYEIFGVQFHLPDLGTNYRFWQDELFVEDPLDEPISQPPPIDRITELLLILEAEDLEITTLDELSRHYRKLSVRYHPLKFLYASDEQKEMIDEHYLAITNAYNELKLYYRSPSSNT